MVPCPIADDGDLGGGVLLQGVKTAVGDEVKGEFAVAPKPKSGEEPE